MNRLNGFFDLGIGSATQGAASIFSTIKAPSLIKQQEKDSEKLLKLQGEQDAARMRTFAYMGIGLGVMALTFIIVKGAVSRKD